MRYPTAGTFASIEEETLSLVQRTLEKAGVEFLNDGQPGVRLKKRP
jgi:hypothetical protein